MSPVRRLVVAVLPRHVRDRWRGREKILLTNARWRLRRLFEVRSRSAPPDGKVCLHLGCGPVDHPGFVNVDAIGFPHVDYLSPVHPLPMFANSSADLIYLSHCLEHLDIEEVPQALREWARILKPGGVLRLAVPDFEAILRVYEASGRRISSVQYVLMGGQDYAFNFHKAVFDCAHLSGLLEQVGFEGIRPWQPGEDVWCDFDDCSRAACQVEGQLIPVSLNLQGTKAGERKR